MAMGPNREAGQIGLKDNKRPMQYITRCFQQEDRA